MDGFEDGVDEGKKPEKRREGEGSIAASNGEPRQVISLFATSIERSLGGAVGTRKARKQVTMGDLVRETCLSVSVMWSRAVCRKEWRCLVPSFPASWEHVCHCIAEMSSWCSEP